MPIESSELRLSIVVPCYNEEESLPELCRRLEEMAFGLVGDSWEVILVNDGSHDRTFDLIREMNERNIRFKGISLSRNFGHQPALAAGLTCARGDAVLVMDADLQDPPEVAADMFRMLATGNHDVVLGVRGKRDAPLIFSFLYRVFYMLMKKLSDHPWPLDAGDFSIFNRRVHRALLSLGERERMLRGLRSWVGFRVGRYVYDRPSRALGESKYNFWRLLSLAKDAFVSFTTVPLRLATMVGFFMSFLTAVLSVCFLINRLFPKFTFFGYSVGANAGIATLAILILTLFSVLYVCVGIMGEYLALLVREVKARPTAIIESVVGNLDSPHPAQSILNVAQELKS